MPPDQNPDHQETQESTARESFLDSMTDPAALSVDQEQPIEQATDIDVGTHDDDQAPKASETRDPKREERKPLEKLATMLDTLTEPEAKPAEKDTKAGEEKPAEAKADDKKPEGEKPADQEEAELLEGVKSERGKERIKQVFSENKELKTDLNSFREMVKSTGFTPQEFAQTLEFGRLLNSGDEKNLRVALQMVEQQREMIYSKLGVEAPGVDLLAGHDDLKAAVENLEITRDKAVELAKFRKMDTAQKQQQQVQQQSAQERQQYENQVKQAAGAMETYLATRQNEVDHPARMKIITEHFKNPAKLQEFVSTYKPEQWAATIKMMYDNIVVPKNQPTPQPIRSRPASLGNPAPSGGKEIDRIAQRMEQMGL